ncbi:hypothetical protein WL30_27430 [Burkholderia ubonensis]|uniref:PRTRC system protein F n=1 Tax=Burkholderia ubonensis TaxID=101571 RepID=UPI0007524AAE|nr:PRTRC system protein F [Burkholderia ubonensis]KVP71077.1 hypothetical protein WJ92_28005 [Burkholderia ubonensis]KWA81318.1 hypothetical protein WL30_27430 [Burkholderia ubonensis]KWB13255.1 hypothetical protein WL31_18855 [Burkholderia ubonensis]
MNSTSMIVPRIAPDVPVRYATGNNRPFTRSLALALMNGGVVTEADAAALDANAGEQQLVDTIVERAWREITADLRLLSWNLQISGNQHDPGFALITIRSDNGYASAPVRYISEGINRLEKAAPGLGQTVLAVLYDVCNHYLPAICTPFETIGVAQQIHWYGEVDELSALEELACMHEMDMPDKDDPDALDAFFEALETPRRSSFFRSAPQWVCYPSRVMTAEQVAGAHLSTADVIFVYSVVGACDDIHRIVTSGGPFARIDSRDADAESIDYAMYLLWDEEDGTTRALDAHWHYAIQGDYLDAMTGVRLPLAGKHIGTWFDRMRNTAQLARATEDLISLISSSHDHSNEPQAVQVRV